MPASNGEQVVAVIRDLTTILHARQELESSAQRFRARGTRPEYRSVGVLSADADAIRSLKSLRDHGAELTGGSVYIRRLLADPLGCGGDKA
jgi:hypothetical protein